MIIKPIKITTEHKDDAATRLWLECKQALEWTISKPNWTILYLPKHRQERDHVEKMVNERIQRVFGIGQAPLISRLKIRALKDPVILVSALIGHTYCLYEWRADDVEILHPIDLNKVPE